MLYRLVKLDPQWQMALLLSAFAVFICLVYGYLYGPRDSYHVVFPLFLLYFLSRNSFAYLACTVFEASLPITGRQILCARILARLALIWVPISAASLTRLALWGTQSASAVRITLEIGAALTLGLLSFSCLHVGKLFVGWRWRYMNHALVITCFGIGAFLFPLLPVSVVAATFAAAAAVLFSCVWVWAPQSFPFAVSEIALPFSQQPLQYDALSQSPTNIRESLAGAIGDGSRSRDAQFWWKPLFQTIFVRPFFWSFAMIVFWLLLGGAWSWFFLFFFVAAGFSQIHYRSHWLFTIPISRRKLFALLLLPQLILTTFIYALQTSFRSYVFLFAHVGQSSDLRVTLIATTVFIACNLLAVLVAHAAWWRGVKRPLRATVGILSFLIVASISVSPFIRKLSLGTYQLEFQESLFQYTMNWFSQILPGNLLTVIGIATVLLGALYWLASKQFSELEVSKIRLIV